MKTLYSILSIVVVFLSGTTAKAQQDPLKLHIEVADSLKARYNRADYKGVYALLSPAFRQQISETDLSTFLRESLYKVDGRIQSLSYVQQKEGSYAFKAQMEQGVLELNLVCNANARIDGMIWTPWKESPGIRGSYLTDNPKNTALERALDSIVAPYLKDANNAGLSIAILRDGNPMFYHYGETQKGNQQLPGSNTLYEIGSITKTFTGILLAQAILDEKVRAKDDIRKYLPGTYTNLQYNGVPITLEQLSNHSSGLPRIPDNLQSVPNFDPLDPYKNYTRQNVFDFLKTVELKTEPGTTNEYSNLGAALLGIILEKVYNQSYESLLQQYIAQPLYMKHTSTVWTPEQQLYQASGYNTQGEPTPAWHMGDMAAAGGIHATIYDMALYIQANIKAGNEAIRLSQQITYQSEKDKWGLGWSFTTKKGGTLIWHNGSTYGFSSFCGFLQGTQHGIVILSNSGNSVDHLAIQIMKLL